MCLDVSQGRIPAQSGRKFRHCGDAGECPHPRSQNLNSTEKEPDESADGKEEKASGHPRQARTATCRYAPLVVSLLQLD